MQYHWFNHGYSSFEHYLEQFTSRKRKSIKRERRKVAEQEVSLKVIEGADISAEQLQHFYHCYQLTYLKRGQQGYLSLEFFRQLVANMSEQMVFFAAEFDSQQVAFALCLKAGIKRAKLPYTGVTGAVWTSLTRCTLRLATTRASTTASLTASITLILALKENIRFSEALSPPLHARPTALHTLAFIER